MLHTSRRRIMIALAMSLLAGAWRLPARSVPTQDTSTIVIDDFEAGKLLGWQSSYSPEYYRGGEGERGLSIVPDAERGSKVLRAEVGFKDPKASEPVFITKLLDDRPRLDECIGLSFWYKITTDQIDPGNGFICRLRAESMAFTDYVIATGETVKPNVWQQATINMSKPPRPVNIYAVIFSKLKEVTFRLDDRDEVNVNFQLFIDDLRLVVKPPVETEYTPVLRPKTTGRASNFLIIKNSAASYYNLEEIAGSLPGRPRVTVLKFRGLHFPVWGFPTDWQKLFEYDVIAMVDVDPYVFTPKQAKMLADFVASGGGLLFAGGPNTFGYSQGFKKPLADLLPAVVTRSEDLMTIGREAKVQGSHPILCGVPRRFGLVRRVHDLRVRQQGADILLTAGDDTTRAWGYYSGGTSADARLAASPDAHSGKHSAALITRDFYKDPKTGKPSWIGVALMLGDTDGYSGPRACLAKPDTTYEFSFWIKGDVPRVAIECLGWKTEKASPEDRIGVPTSPNSVTLTGLWTQVRGTFKTPPTIARMALKLGIQGNPNTLKLGQQMLVDDAELREASSAKNVLVNPGAEEKNERPVLILSAAGEGRVAVLNTYPEVERTTEGSLFTGDSYDDLMRQCFRWLAQQPMTPGIATFQPPPAQLVRGDKVVARATASLSSLKRAAMVWELWHGDELCKKVSSPLLSGSSASFKLALPHDWQADGQHTLRCSLTDSRGQVLDFRDCSFAVEGPLGLALEFPCGKSVFAAGDELRIIATRNSNTTSRLLLTWEVWDDEGQVVHRSADRTEDDGRAQLAWQLPPLENGAYRIKAVARREANSQQPDAVASTTFEIVNRLDMSRFYPVISWLGTSDGGHLIDERGLRERVDDLAGHGFNTIAFGGLRKFPEKPLSNTARLLNYAERYAQRKGMAVIYEYESFNLVGHQAKTVPCVYAPEYPKALAERLDPMIRAANLVPRLMSVKITDEPFADENNMDYCSYCQEACRQRYSRDLPKLKELGPDDIPGHLHYNEFVSDYVSHGYEQAYRRKAEGGNRFGLLLTYCSPAYGYANVENGQEDAFEWSKHADYVDFDVYPYFYPSSQIIRMVLAHSCFGVMRAIARHLGKPMGFYVELDDRNYPYQINPVEASSECAYTAIGQGCDYLNSFINVAFGTGCQSRPERWEDLGRELRKVAVVHPLLKRLRKAESKVALFFPHTQWYALRKGFGPQYAYQLFLRAYGEVDVLHEKIARETGIKGLRAVLLLSTKLLPDDMADMLTRFVREGGLLICDGVPTLNEMGAACKLSPEMFGGTETVVAGSLTMRVKDVGRGRTVLFSDSLDNVFRDAVEKPEPKMREACLSAAGGIFSQRGIRAYGHATNPDFEADTLLGDNCASVVVINHGELSDSSSVEVANLPFAPKSVCDLSTGEAVQAVVGVEGTSFTVKLAPRRARLFGLYPTRPARVEVSVKEHLLHRGDTLSYTVVVRGEDGAAAKGSHIVTVNVKDPKGRERTRYGGQFATDSGTLRLDLPVAANATIGKWTIEAAERLSARAAKTDFRIAGGT